MATIATCLSTGSAALVMPRDWVDTRARKEVAERMLRYAALIECPHR